MTGPTESEEKRTSSADVELTNEEYKIASDLILWVFEHHPPPNEHCKLATVLGDWVHDHQDNFPYQDESQKFDKERLRQAFRKRLCAQAKEARQGSSKPLRWNDVNKFIQVNEMRRLEDDVSTAASSRVSSAATEADPDPVSSELNVAGDACDNNAYVNFYVDPHMWHQDPEPKVHVIPGKAPAAVGRQQPSAPPVAPPPGLELPGRPEAAPKGKKKLKKAVTMQDFPQKIESLTVDYTLQANLGEDSAGPLYALAGSRSKSEPGPPGSLEALAAAHAHAHAAAAAAEYAHMMWAASYGLGFPPDYSNYGYGQAFC